MEKNIQFKAVLKNGAELPINVNATSIFQAAFELLESIAVGDICIDPCDVVKIVDIPG